LRIRSLRSSQRLVLYRPSTSTLVHPTVSGMVSITAALLARHLLICECGVFFFFFQMYEGGYGQTPLCKSLGGPTYCALASMHLIPAEHPCASQARLQPTEWRATVRWLLHMQSQQTPQTQTEVKLGGGFAGQTNKLADACYGFWCDAALAICPFPFRFLAAQSTHNTPNMPATPFLFFFSHLLPFAPRCPERLGACTPDREDQETCLTPLGSFAVRNVHEAVTHITGQMFVRAMLGVDSQLRDSDIYNTSML
jgi:hypothetical protein